MSIEKKQQLNEKQLIILESEMRKQKKSLGLSYILLVFLGSLGVHKFYLGKTLWGIIYLVLGIFGWIAIFTESIIAFRRFSYMTSGFNPSAFGIIGIICEIVLGIFIIIDLFTLPKQVKTINNEIEAKIINEILLSQTNE